MLAMLLLLFNNVIAADVWVNGYTKSDGTYVAGYYRTSPDSTTDNNYSTIGNFNPYTLEYGTKNYNMYSFDSTTLNSNDAYSFSTTPEIYSYHKDVSYSPMFYSVNGKTSSTEHELTLVPYMITAAIFIPIAIAVSDGQGLSGWTPTEPDDFSADDKYYKEQQEAKEERQEAKEVERQWKRKQRQFKRHNR